MIKTILSYFWTITKKIPSDYSGEIEVSLYRGKKFLDTKNANYSYGTLQKILEKGINQIDLSSVSAVLILGMGAGSAIQSLRQKYNYQKHIDAVEIDRKIIEIAKNEFDISANENTTIINDDAIHFLQKSNQKYDLIIIDIFIDTRVPKQFYSKDFVDMLIQHLSKNATVLFNLGMDATSNDKALQSIQYFKQKGFKTKVLKKVERFNTLLIAKAL